MIPPIARRFVAGETPAAALEHARTLNEDDIGAILNLLGEHYDDRSDADADRDAYLELIDDIASMGVEACISVKPSQIGLDVGEEVYRENYSEIVEYAADRDVFVWSDMEDYPTVDATLDAFEREARAHNGGVGVCLQANLKRTQDDVARLVDVPGTIRLVKGAYNEPASIAYQDSSRVNQSYRELLSFLFEHYDDGQIAVGSHDPEMLSHASKLNDEFGTDYEVQMLMGVREDAQRDLATEVPVYQYVPYGSKWLSYFYRRVVERKENVLFALRAILGR
jgi:proline dehydrogenase